MRTKFFNDGVIGNEKITASISERGELLRLFYGSADFKQFVDYFHAGIKINDSGLIYLHQDVNNRFSQEYVKNSNVLKTEIYNAYFNVKITQTDFVPINENILIRKYVVRNENRINMDVNLLLYSKTLTNINNDTSGYFKYGSLIQYNHDFAMCTFAKEEPLSYQINNVSNDFMSGIIGGKDYIGMSPDSGISYSLGSLKPGDEKELVVFLYINRNKENSIISDLGDEIERIRKLDVDKLLKKTIKFWNDYIIEHDIKHVNETRVGQRVKEIYNRSILLFPLLINHKTGGVSAGIEVDEGKTKCGRYSYCWTRDAVFITEAFDIVGMSDKTELFYLNFCKNTQCKNGMWEQRFYTDGRLAPSWGYQIDETASVIFGIYAHYKFKKDKKFLKDTLNMCEKAISFLEVYIDDILEGKKEMQLSYDLWEEREGYNLYSLASIFFFFFAMIKIYGEIKSTYRTKEKQDDIDKKIDNLSKKVLKIREYCSNNFFDEEKKCYVRNMDDRKMDISILGTIVPFYMFSPKDKKIENTIERMEMTLRTYTGGFIRYEDDTYMSNPNPNPWGIATLWMAWYYLETGRNKEAMECFSYVTNTASKNFLLGEQINNQTMKPAWVIGLTWSHAMYLIILEKLLDKGLLK